MPPRTILEDMSHRLKTLDDYLRLDDDIRVELIEGEFVVTASPTPKHQVVIGNLYLLLEPRVHRLGLGKVYLSPLDTVLSKHNVLQPDLLFIAHDHSDRVQDRVNGPPDLVIEVLSPRRAAHDRRVKKRLYRRYGVSEYWIVDPKAESVQVLELRDGRWTERGVFAKDDAFEPRVLPGVAVRVRDVFA